MARVIDTIIRLTDRFTPVLNQVKEATTKYSKVHQRMGRDIEKTGKSMQGIGKAMLPLAGGIMAVGAASISIYSGYDDVMLSVKAKTQANAKEYDALRKKAEELGAATRFSTKEAAQGMDYLAMAGYNTNQIIAAMPGLLNFAAASGTELALTADIVSDVMTAFGWAAEETERFADVMAYTTAKSNTSVAIMGETFKYIAPVANAAGVSFEETAAATGMLANASIKGSMAGTALKNMINQLVAPSKSTADTMRQLGMEVVDSQGKFVGFRSVVEQFSKATEGMGEAQRTAYANALVGERGMTGLLAMCSQGVEKFDELHNGILNSSGAAQEMADTMNSGIGGAMAAARSAVESVAITIGNKLAPSIMSASQVIISISQSINKLSPGAMQLIIYLAGAVLAFTAFSLIVGTILVKVGGMIKLFGTIGVGIVKAGGVIAYLGKSFAGIIWLFKAVGMAAKLLFATPVGLAILAVVGIIAIIIKNWETFGAIFKRIGVAIANEVTYIKNSILAWAAQMGLTGKFSMLFTQVSIMFVRLKDTLASVLEWVIDFVVKVVGFFAGLWTGLTSGTSLWSNIFLVVFDETLNSIGVLVNGILDVLSGIIMFLTGVFTGDWGKAWQGVVEVFGAIFNVIIGIVKNVLNVVKETINAVIKSINGVSFKVPNWVPGVGGSNFSPNIPMLSKGTDNWQGGRAMVHEKGAEIIDLPRGSRVVPHDKSLQSEYQRGLAASSMGGNITIAKLADSIVIREDADIEKIVRQLVYELKANAINQTAKAF